MQNCKEFNAAYAAHIKNVSPTYNVVEIGSQDVNGSLRSLWSGVSYIGVDFVEGKGVDVILDDPYKLPFEDASVDVVLSSSVFEHSEMFWVLYLEIMRILKPHGLFYLNVPSNGDFHRWPVDCWRFYPDSGKALITWAKRSGMTPALLESYVSNQSTTDRWNDFVAVYVKDEQHVGLYPTRILDTKKDILNGTVYGETAFINQSTLNEDHKRLAVIKHVTERTIGVV